MMFRSSLAMALAFAVAAPFAHADTARPSLSFLTALGGSVREPVVDASGFVYVPTGAVVTAWDLRQPGTPVRLGDTGAQPTTGKITALTRRGAWLYASWTRYDGTDAGVAVYSLADPAHPQLVREVNDYTDEDYRYVTTIVATGDRLYLFDQENGLFVGNLSDPARPTFTRTLPTGTGFSYAYAHGNHLYAIGRNWLGGTMLQVYDITQPDLPLAAGLGGYDGFNDFRLKLAPPLAVGFGLAIDVHDVSDPWQPVDRGMVESPVALNGAVVGTHAYGLGMDGIDVWTLANPDAPAFVAHSTIDAFATDEAVPFGNAGLLAFSRADRLLHVDVGTPAQPLLRSDTTLRGGLSPRDVLMRGDKALFLEEVYGLNVANPASLEPIGRFDANLPLMLQQRDFEQMAVDGNRAYLAAWGMGLMIVDITDPLNAHELGRFEYDYAGAVAANGNYAYIGRATNGGEMVTLDVSDPSKPVPLGVLFTSRVMRLDVRGQHVFIADQEFAGDRGGGLRIADVSQPELPVQVGFYNACGSADDLALNPQGTLAVLGCNDGMHVVDIRNPANPVALGVFERAAYVPTTVALDGTRVYFGGGWGIAELDIADPAHPTLVAEHALPMPPDRLRVSGDGRLFAFSVEGGIQVFRIDDRLFANGFD
ncbi:MAG: hypothetical protein GXC76_11105 [Rhodanobacteraceae bacterium]|nr:hypothetical protein [Rhodanobacteraceae bacterium]